MSWFLGVAVPAVGVGTFVATRKRLSLQWREELMDPACSAYPPLRTNEFENFCTVESETSECDILKKSIGLRVSSGLSEDDADMLLREVREWVQRYGNPFDPRIVSYWEEQCAATGVDPKRPGMNRLVSDHAEDVQQCKAPWGTGDKIDFAEMPAVLRSLISKVQEEFAGIGRVRHVYIEYSPTGEFFHKPNVTKGFDGHDYVIIPLRAKKADSVFTFSPSCRSRSIEMKEVLLNSWSPRDLDALVPNGKMLRVYGAARYDYSWSIRPGCGWFGTPKRQLLEKEQSGQDLPSTTESKTRPFWKIWGNSRVNDVQTAESIEDAKTSDAAVIALHFEGPRAQGKKRSLALHPEALIFGSKPEPATFERWVDDRPTEEDVWKDYVVLFMLKNYLRMLSSS